MGWLRTWLRVTASLAGLAAGAAIGDGATAEDERDQDPAPSLESSGASASGTSFYVWDEDPGQARRWAAELARWPALKDDDFG